MKTEVKTLDMTKGSPVGLILKFSLPLMLGNILQQLYSIVDTAIVGQGVGINALASLGAADWLNWFVLWIIQGLTQGFAVLIAQRFGARKIWDMKKTVAMSAVLCLVSGILLTVISEAAALPALRLLDTPDSIIEGAHQYLRIIYGGILIVMAYNMSSCILRAVGDSKSPMYAIVIAAALNVTLDLLFVMVFQWGIAGAAAATVLSQLFSFLYCLVKISRLPELHLNREAFHMNVKLCGKLMGQGIPNAVSMAFIAIGGMVVQLVVNGNGETFVAGFTAANKLYGLLECISFAYASAMSTYMGQNMGAGQITRLRLGMKKTLPVLIGNAIVFSMVMFAFGRLFLRVFISGDSVYASEVETIAFQYLMVGCAFLWVLYPVNVFRAALQGLGESGIAAVSGILELGARALVVLVCVPLIYDGFIYCAEVAAWIASGIYLPVCFYYKLHRMEYNVI